MHQHLNISERKWQQPWLQLHLVTKFHGKQELGLPTASPAVLPRKMMPCTMFRAMQTFCEHQFFVCMNRPFYYFFICSLYSPWATIRLLHHQFWLFMYINFRLCCTHFSCHWRKICNVSGQLVQISRRQRDPWMSKKEKEIITLTVRILFSDLKKWKYPFFPLKKKKKICL